MRVYLARHGRAMEKEVDPERSLRPDGLAEVERVARFLANARLDIPQCWHSGKARARQTAEILVKHIAPGAPVEAHEGLAPNDPVKPVAAELRRRNEDLLIAGHLPFLAKLASLLVAGDSEADLLTLPSGAVLCLERIDAGAWTMAWFVTPELAPGKTDMGASAGS